MARAKKGTGFSVAKPKRKPRTVTARTSSVSKKNVQKAKKQVKAVRKAKEKLSTPYFDDRRKMFDTMDDTCDGTANMDDVVRIAKKVIKHRCKNK